MPKRVTMIVVGAGDRGNRHAEYALQHPDEARVVGVAEPRDFQREHLAMAHGIDAGNVYTDWRDMAARGRFADAVLICTSDAMHVEPVLAFASKGYQIMLEKPLAPTPEGCRAIIDAVKQNGVMLAVGHVLRYTPHTQTLKRILDGGTIGEVVCIQHLEPVGYWHQAHSYVRGNWRKESESSFTMTCFNQGGHRRTNIFGTRGEIRTAGDKIKVFDFISDQWTNVEIDAGAADVTGGHGGGDYVLMQRFVAAVANKDPSIILSGPDETLDSHLIVFAAEASRREHCVKDL
jgi:hypothetical protein